MTVDRTKATLPPNHSLWNVVFTYGGMTRISVLVSAYQERQAKKIVQENYSYLNPKILAVTYVSNDTQTIYDRSKQHILGKLNIIETRKED